MSPISNSMLKYSKIDNNIVKSDCKTNLLETTLYNLKFHPNIISSSNFDAKIGTYFSLVEAAKLSEYKYASSEFLINIISDVRNIIDTLHHNLGSVEIDDFIIEAATDKLYLVNLSNCKFVASRKSMSDFKIIDDIVDHFKLDKKLVNDIKPVVESSLELNLQKTETYSGFRDLIKSTTTVMISYFGKLPIKIFFLAIDILERLRSHITDKNEIQYRNSIIYLAINFYDPQYTMKEYLGVIKKEKNKKMIDIDVILNYLSGVVYRDYIYSSGIDVDQLVGYYDDYIMSRNIDRYFEFQPEHQEHDVIPYDDYNISLFFE